MDTWAKEFNEQVSREGLGRKNFLVGYSLGGRLALHALNQNSALWEGIMAISTHPGLELNHKERLKADEAWACRFENDPWYPLLADWMSQEVFKGSKSPLRVESDFNRATLASLLRNYSLGKQKILSHDKVHWVVGERDAGYRALLPEATVVPNAGHRVLFDNPEALKQLICKWIAL